MKHRRTQSPADPAPVELSDLKSAYASLMQIERGRVSSRLFMALAKEARHLDPVYLDSLMILCRALGEGRFNGSIIDEGNRALRDQSL